MNPFAELSRPLVSRPCTPLIRPIHIREPEPPKPKPQKRELPEFPHVYNRWALSSAQCEILRRIALGETPKHIAFSLNVSFKTIYTQIRRTLKKMDVKTLERAAVLWDREFPEVRQ